MAKNKEVSLTEEEKRVVKALLAKGWRNQDIQALVNLGRKFTINSGRITGVKKADIASATDDEVALFQLKKRSYDPVTGLNALDDERLVRAREAMILAVQIFNSPALRFKTEVFSVLANISWTYLMHEHYLRKGQDIMRPDGKSIALSEMTGRPDCPLSDDIKNNLRALKILRDNVEHLLLGTADQEWLPMYQACCVNFDKTLCALFGDRLTLASDLSLALQFAKMDIERLAQLNSMPLPPKIAALDAQLTEGMTPAQINSLEFQFRVVYTLDAATKDKAHFKFLNPEAAADQTIHNVLVKKVAADDQYPHKPNVVAKLVAAKTGKIFTPHNHQQAYKLHKIRPKGGATNPNNTNRTYCIYNAAHKDYTYSDEWLARLVAEVNDPEKFAAIKAVKL